MNKLGIYIHIPFCNAKCSYCDFVSSVCGDDVKAAYFSRLRSDILEFASSGKAQDKTVDSIYFGGGTPTSVAEKYIAQIIDLLRSGFNVASDCETTIEANPESLTSIKAECYASSGINRISIGLQSATDSLLSEIGRIHTVYDFIKAADIAQSRFNNVSADLMLALPGQTVRDVEKAINLLAGRQFNHISAYSLKVEEGTPLFSTGYQPDEDYAADLYSLTRSMLEQYGYKGYEVSNFALPGYECRHNIRYWMRGEYLGFGVAAHSFYDNERYCMTSDLKAYLSGEGITEKTFIQPDGEEAAEETAMLALRTSYGLDLEKYRQTFGRDLLKDRGELIEELTESGYAEINNGKLKLTDKGLYVMNEIIVRLVLLK